MDMFQTNQLTQDVGTGAIAHVAAVGCLDLAKVGLSIANQSADKDRTLAELVAAVPTYTGYALGSVTWSAATISDDGFIEFLGTVPEFRPADAVAADSIYLMFLQNTAGTKLYGVGRFDGAPLPMRSALDAIQLTLRWRPHDQSLVVFVS